MGGYLYWNGFIRLSMEVYQDMLLMTIMNLMAVDWSTPFGAVSFSNAASLTILVLLSMTPIVLVMFFCFKR